MCPKHSVTFNQRLTGHTIICWMESRDAAAQLCGTEAENSEPSLSKGGEGGGGVQNQEKRQLKRRKAKTCSAFALTWFQLIRLLYTMNITSTLYL